MLSKGKPDYNPKEDEYWDSLPGTTGKMKPTSEFIIKHVRKAIEEGADKVEEAERKKKEEERREAMKKQSVSNNVCIVFANDYPIEEFTG